MTFDITHGSTFQSAHGGRDVWISQCSYIDVDGRRRFIRGIGATEREAERRRQQNIVRRMSNPTRISASVRELFDEWIDSYGDRITNTTRAEYRRNIEQHVLPHIGDVQLVNLDPVRVGRLFTHDLANIGGGAKVNAYKTLNHMMTWAVKNRRLDANPLRAVPRPTHTAAVHADDDKYIDRRTNVAIQMLDWMQRPDCPYHGDYNRVLFSFLGLRRGELLGMTWDCIDNLNRKGRATLRVRQQLQRSNELGWHIVSRTKNGRERKIPLPEMWRLALLDERKRQADVLSPNEWQSNLVWLTRDGSHITYNEYNDRWHAILTAWWNRNHADDPQPLRPDQYWRAHANRHLTASIMFRAGESLEYVQDILGHSDEIMTLYYTHFSDAAKREIMNTYEQAIDRANWNELRAVRRFRLTLFRRRTPVLSQRSTVDLRVRSKLPVQISHT